MQYIPWFILSNFLLVSVVFGGDRGQWGRAWDRNMVAEEGNLPETFDVGKGVNVRWVAALGTQCFATPVVSGGKVFICTNNERPRDSRHSGDRGVLMCLEEATGKLVWQLVSPKWELGEAPNYRDWPKVGMASPATVEGERVYIVSNRAEVLCLDVKGMANGNDGPFKDEGRHMSPAKDAAMEVGATDADILWTFDMVKEVDTWQHDQIHASILIDGDYLYVLTGNGVDNTHRAIRRPDAPSLIVLNKKTGRLVARDDLHIGPGIIHATWSSPAMGVVNGKKMLVLGGANGTCYGLEPVVGETEGVQTLKLIWSFDCDPTAPKDRPQLLNKGPGSPGGSNILGMPVIYEEKVYVAAGGDTWWGKKQAWLKCIDAGQRGDVTRTAERWSYEMPGHCMATPAIAGGLVFIVDSSRQLHCVDAGTGKGVWVQKLNGEPWGSPLVGDGKVYMGTRKGDYWILAASKELKVLCAAQFGEAINSTTTAANGTIYVSTMTKLYAIGK